MTRRSLACPLEQNLVADVARPPTWAFPGSIASTGMAVALRGVPTVSSPPSAVHGQQGEAKTAKNRNGYAGWNPGYAVNAKSPERTDTLGVRGSV